LIQEEKFYLLGQKSKSPCPFLTILNPNKKRPENFGPRRKYLPID